MNEVKFDRLSNVPLFFYYQLDFIVQAHTHTHTYITYDILTQTLA